jgi:Na+-translocating ferredoxin:NAD+ oxidoreductase subunit E
MRAPRDLLLLISLCPFLAVTDTVVKAAGLGAATIIVTVVASGISALLVRWLDDEFWLPAILLILASLVAIVELIFQAWFHDLRELLGLFLALIVTNAAIVWTLLERRAGAYAASMQAVKLALSIALVLLVLGIARELVGRGSLLHGAVSMLGSWASAGELSLFRVDMGFLLAMLPPGAFIALGLLIAIRNWLAQRTLPHS